MQAEVGSSGGYSWVRIFVAGVQRYAVVLADRCRLVTLSPGDAFAACVAQGDAGGGAEELKSEAAKRPRRSNRRAESGQARRRQRRNALTGRKLGKKKRAAGGSIPAAY